MTTPLRQRAAFTALQSHYESIKQRHLRDLFREDPKRAEKFSIDALGFYFDYSKHRITDETVGLLIDLANQSNLTQRRDAMFAVDKINVTENRAVLHIALRA